MTQRLDVALVELGKVSSRSRAADLIAQGKVSLDGQIVKKVSQKISLHDAQRVSVDDHPWVSRAGLKLAGALHHWAELEQAVSGAICLDLGASTGGFTQVLLHKGAKQVYAVDVGTDQLHASLKANPSVTSLEQTNCRDLTLDHIPKLPTVIVSDLSFISLKIALPAALNLASPNAWLMALIKPQFEVGRDKLGKGGVVREPQYLTECLDSIKAWLSEFGWPVIDIKHSPIDGPDGNTEFLCLARYSS